MDKTEITAEKTMYISYNMTTMKLIFQRYILQNGLKCKVFKCKSMAFVFTRSIDILHNSI